jgi:hypothetical protein
LCLFTQEVEKYLKDKEKKKDKAFFWLDLPIKSGDHRAFNTIKINPQFVEGDWVFVET